MNIIIIVVYQTECTKVGFRLSESQSINRSVVQGSWTGPGMFLVYIADMKALAEDNSSIKFVDDCSLVVLVDSNASVETEMISIRESGLWLISCIWI